MTTPPRIHRKQLDEALQSIIARRREIDDEEFGQVNIDQPGEVLDYLHKQNVKLRPDQHAIAKADVLDGLVLHLWEWWEERRRLRDLLRAGLAAGASLSQLGSPLGLGSRVQSKDGNRARGVQDLMDRLDALLQYDRPDASLTREARRLEREGAVKGDPQAAWFQAHRAWVSATAARLVSCKPWADDEAASDLIEVERDWRNDEWSEGSLVWMALATQSLRVAPEVLELGPGHRVHKVFKAVDDLRTAFANLAAPERE